MKTPIFLVDKKKIIEQIKKLKPLGKISYSFKTNPFIGKFIEKNTNLDFTITSLKHANEIQNKKRIWYIAQAWDKDEALKLLEIGVNKFIIDNIHDLNVLKEVVNTNITLLLRINIRENTIYTGKYYVYGFGSKETNQLLKSLKKENWIDTLGIHFHRKTENISEWDLVDELNYFIHNWDLVDLINIGGGLPVKYANIKNFNIDTIFSKIKELNSLGKPIMLEPGRFISAPPVKLITKIKSIVKNTIFVDSSVYNASPDTLIYSIKLLVENEGKGKPYLIKGNTPCSLDIFRYKVYLPDPKPGKSITFINAGAYNYRTTFMDLDEIPHVFK